jgi:hypothetical protein
MSDELLAHKRALEILQQPGKREHLRERAKKHINITELNKRQEVGEPFEEDDEALGIYSHENIYKILIY